MSLGEPHPIPKSFMRFHLPLDVTAGVGDWFWDLVKPEGVDLETWGNIVTQVVKITDDIARKAFQKGQHTPYGEDRPILVSSEMLRYPEWANMRENLGDYELIEGTHAPLHDATWFTLRLKESP